MAEATNIEVTLNSEEGLQRHITVRVPNEQIEQQVTSRLTRIGKTARLKGFRPGKAPARIIRQRYGADVRQEVLGEVIRSSYSQAIQQQSLRPAGGPSIEMLPESETHFEYKASFEVYPVVEVAPLEKLAIDITEVNVEDGDVEDMIEKLRAQRATWVDVDRAAAKGDQVVIDFIGRLDGEPFEGGEGNGVTIAVGEGQVIEDFDAALEGQAAADTKTATVRFPDEYPSENLAGKDAEFDITAVSVKERTLPEVDEEFMEAFGVTEGGIDGLRAEVRANMQRELNERLRGEAKAQTLDALFAANEFDIPAALVEEEARNIQAAAMQRMGISDAAKAPPRSQFTDTARRRVGLGLIVERIIAAEDLVIDRDRIDERIAELCEPYENPEQAAQIYRTNRDLMAQVESSVLEDQVVDLVLEKAKIKTKKLAFEEFMNPA